MSLNNWNGETFLDNVPTKDKFMKDLITLYKKYNVYLSHEDYQGAFELIKGYDENAVEWISHCHVPGWQEGE